MWTTQFQGWTSSSGSPALKPKLHFTWRIPPPDCQPLSCNPVHITVNVPTTLDQTPTLSRVYGLGVDISGKDPIGKFKLHFLEPQNETLSVPTSTNAPKLPNKDKSVLTIVKTEDLKQTLAIETGYQDASAWMEWIKYSVRTLNKSDCYACATGRPEAQIVPFPLGWSTDSVGMTCMVALFQDSEAGRNASCTSLSLLFPVTKGSAGQPSESHNATCGRG